MKTNKIIKDDTDILNKVQSSNGYDIRSFNAGFFAGIEYVVQHNKNKDKKQLQKKFQTKDMDFANFHCFNY